MVSIPVATDASRPPEAEPRGRQAQSRWYRQAWRGLGGRGLLTGTEQRELTRVAGGNEESVAQVARLVEQLVKFNTQFYIAYWSLVGSFFLLVVGVAIAEWEGPWLANLMLGLSAIPLARIFWLVLRMQNSLPKSGARVVQGLNRIVRELQKPKARFGTVSRMLDDASNRFYDRFRAPSDDLDFTVLRRTPRRYRVYWETEAALGAQAIASQAFRLCEDPPNREVMADDLRRAMIRIAGGHWREVKDLNASPGSESVWTPPGRWRRLTSWLHQQESTLKLLTLLGAVVGLLTVVLRGLLG